MNKKMSFILLLLCFGLLPSVAQASSGDIGNDLVAFLFMTPAAILSIFSLIDMAIFHKLSPRLTYLTQHSRLEIPIIIMMIINYIVYLILFEGITSFLADSYNFPHFITILFVIISIIYFAVIIKNSRIQSPDSYRPPIYKPLKTTVIAIIIINNLISLFLFLLCITIPYRFLIEFFSFGGFLVPIQLVASVIFLKKELKKEYSYPEPPNTP